MKFLRSVWFPIAVLLCVVLVATTEMEEAPQQVAADAVVPLRVAIKTWQAPTMEDLGKNPAAGMIKYGHELMAHTSVYLGPKGSVAAISNGMNCQNCHVEAGAKPYGNCLAAVAATYPVFKPRSGIIESIEFRINDCLQRSLNGKTIDSNSKEMHALVAYLNYLGKGVSKTNKPAGVGMQEISFIERAADPVKGQTVYTMQCSRCHGANGEGQLRFDSIEYTYPPLWGPNSYNVSAGLYRISRLAAYAKNNMPFGLATHENPQLSDEAAWDVAAFINSQPRPAKRFAGDWPDISKKAIDYPFGPYTDGFTELQHKFGPFAPIKKVTGVPGNNSIHQKVNERL